MHNDCMYVIHKYVNKKKKEETFILANANRLIIQSAGKQDDKADDINRQQCVISQCGCCIMADMKLMQRNQNRIFFEYLDLKT